MNLVRTAVAAIILGALIGTIVSMIIYFKNKRKLDKMKAMSNELHAELTRFKHTKAQLLEEKKILETKLQHTFEDPVTSLSGWQLFEDRLNRSIRESERFHMPLAVLFVDVDDFKVINDALGYTIGDALLKAVGQRLRTYIRQVDSISRFTKDTYVILLTQLSKPEIAAVIAQRIMQAIMEPFQIDNQELNITVCIGIAIYPADGADSASLLRSADHALNLAKQKGHHTYQFYQERLHVQSQRELILYNSLAHDTIFNDFIVYYSPIINMRENKVIAMEALLYWQHVDLGLINPNELFSYAEKQRKLNLISEWLLRHACKQYLHWQTLGFYLEYICIPVTIKQFENTHFIYRISQILQEIHFRPAALIIQVNEKPRDIPFEVLDKAFNMLKYLGIKIMVDHFGAGLFPLMDLKDFPIHYLKLDAALTVDLESNPKALALVNTLHILANNLGLQVIAQNVMTEKQKNIFQEAGYDLLQGPIVSRPLNEKEIEEKLIQDTLFNK